MLVDMAVLVWGGWWKAVVEHCANRRPATATSLLSAHQVSGVGNAQGASPTSIRLHRLLLFTSSPNECFLFLFFFFHVLGKI